MQLVELKNGETYNGHMVQCDSWMNVHLREVICTSKVQQSHEEAQHAGRLRPCTPSGLSAEE